MQLPEGVPVDVSRLGGESVVWWPEAQYAGAEVKVDEDRRELVSREVVPIGCRGVFVRQWGGKGSGEGQFNYPWEVCVSGGEVFVCDGFNHRVQVFGMDGRFVRQWGGKGSGEGQFDRPVGVCVSGGEVFVCDGRNDRVQVLM